MSENGEISEIPLPVGPTFPHFSSMMNIPLPPLSEVHSILKKSPMLVLAPGTPTFQGRDPPGVPSGPPPDLIEMDEASEEEMEASPEPPALVDNKSKGVRFSDTDKNEDKTMSEMDRFMKEVFFIS
jgi:hypothetical protein